MVRVSVTGRDAARDTLRANGERGFSYLLLLFIIAFIGAGLAALGDAWVTTRQRDREAELLFAGGAIRQAIASYYDATPGPLKQYPGSIEHLLKDPRFPDTRRHLRQIYPDPMTGTMDWVLIPAAGRSGIMGVASASEAPPLKRSGFLGSDRVFEDQALRLKEKLRYRDWEFNFEPTPVRPGARQGAGG